RAWAERGHQGHIAGSTLVTRFQDEAGAFGSWSEISMPTIGSRPCAVDMNGTIHLFAIDRATFEIVTCHQKWPPYHPKKGTHGFGPGYPWPDFTSWEPIGTGA